MNCPNDRYVNDGKIIQAIGQMWTRIGVQTTVDAMAFEGALRLSETQLRGLPDPEGPRGRGCP